jgi:flagellar biosynthesis chaperone FliJ
MNGIDMKDNRLNWYRHVYQFVEILPMSRNQYMAQIQKFGWRVPIKSRCWMCPKQSQEAWKQMKKLRNGDFERAVELENAVR